MVKNCCNCGAPIDPYRVKCEYCGTMYFDWATWMKEGEPCFISYSIDDKNYRRTITTQAIPHLEEVAIEGHSSVIEDMAGVPIRTYRSGFDCNLRVDFTCLVNPETKSLLTIKREG